MVSLLAGLLANEGDGFALIPYAATTIDLSNAGAVGPLDPQSIENNYYRHWLGTDELGRDVLAQLIHGGRTAFLVGFFSVLISALIGISLGMTAGFLGDRELRLSRLNAYLIPILSFFLLLYLAFVFPWSAASIWQALIFVLIFLFLIFLIAKVGKSLNSSKQAIPVDLIIGRMIEAMDSLPILFIIISLSAIIRPSIFSVILIIGISNWAKIARYARSETMKIKQMAYIESARAIGLNRTATIWRHILPNALPTLGVALAFNIAAAILIEATLSFLGVGIGVEEASWGAMLSEARRSPFAWWLAVFPGLAIFGVVYACNQLAEAFSD
jgi:peptide/nickel transport system permease protein